MLRTFVAVEIAPSARQLAAELAKKCRDLGVDAKWVEPDNLHLTLQFLGNVRETDIHTVFASLSRAVRPLTPFDVVCRGVGAFPHADRPHVVWLGIDEGREPLVGLQAVVAQALGEIGFRGEARRFEPHVTLGRIRRGPGPELAAFLREHAEDAFGAFDVSEILVVASRPERRGPRYEVLGRAELRGA
ncbi:MAG: RNA 2',3'-cyclic phosphodiesterase [Planctomycetes bacterium]|nr:RNA 2',3'-cyclic phosphodiesterase [Planctomycetota bacterium]